MKTIKYFIFFRKYLWKSLGITCLVLVQTLLSLICPLIIQKYIDNGLGNINYKSLIMHACTYLAICILLYAVKLSITYTSEKLGWKVTNELRIVLLKKILLNDENFFALHSVGELIERLDKDIVIIFHFITNKLVNILINGLLLVGILMIFYKENIYIGIIFTLFVILSLVIIYMIQKNDSDILYKEREYATVATSTYSEWINMKKEMDALNKTNYITEKYDEISNKLLILKINSQKYLYRVWSLTLFLLAIANILTLYIGGILYINNIMTIGFVYLLYSYSNMLKEPFENLQSQIQAILNVRTVIKRLKKLVNYIPEVTDGNKIITTSRPAIKFKDVTYYYNESSIPALRNVSILINGGDVLGILGASGSGKSTFCKIICKLLEVKEGQVFIDNVDISELSIKNIRQNIAYVSIDSHIFNDSLKNNLTLFNDKITEEEIEKLLIKYNLLNLLKKGELAFLSKIIDENTISSGEKQLICFCRILFKMKKIIILDESSSRINSNMEEIFINLIKALSSESTIIVISHDLQQINDCAKTVYFKDGCIIDKTISF